MKLLIGGFALGMAITTLIGVVLVYRLMWEVWRDS